MRASEMRIMSRTPCAQELLRDRHVADLGHARIALGAAVLQDHDAARRRCRAHRRPSARCSSSMFSNTTARPVWRISSGEAAEGLMTAPSGARLPRRIAMPASGLNGVGEGRDHLAVPALGVLDVLPDRAAVHGQRVLVQEPPLAQGRAARPAARRRSRSPPSGSGPRASGRRGSGRRGRARSKSSSVSSMPTRPCDRQEMHDGVGGAADGTQGADRVLERLAHQDLRQHEVLAHHLDDPPARPCGRARCGGRPTAGMAAFSGRPTPSASTIEAMVEAVPMVMQWPELRFIAASASWNSSIVISPARSCSLIEMMLVPEPMIWPR